MSAQSESPRLRPLYIKRYVGIIPPLKYIVKTIIYAITLRIANLFLVSRYAPIDVKSTLIKVPVTTTINVVRYPDIIFGFLNTILYAARLKPAGFSSNPSSSMSLELSEREAITT